MPSPTRLLIRSSLACLAVCMTILHTGCQSTVTGATTEMSIEQVHEEPQQTATDALIIRIHLPDGTVQQQDIADTTDGKDQP